VVFLWPAGRDLVRFGRYIYIYMSVCVCLVVCCGLFFFSLASCLLCDLSPQAIVVSLSHRLIMRRFDGGYQSSLKDRLSALIAELQPDAVAFGGYGVAQNPVCVCV
jgi:hypothetical protein